MLSALIQSRLRYPAMHLALTLVREDRVGDVYKRQVEAGGIRGVAVKCLDITKNSDCEGSLLSCN